MLWGWDRTLGARRRSEWVVDDLAAPVRLHTGLNTQMMPAPFGCA